MTPEEEESAALDGAYEALNLDRGNLNPYDVLGVRASATQKEVGRAYRQKVKEFHPDRHVGADARKRSILTAVFHIVRGAEETIGDPEKRRRFDSGGGQRQESSGSWDHCDHNRSSQELTQSSQESWQEGSDEAEDSGEEGGMRSRRRTTAEHTMVTAVMTVTMVTMTTMVMMVTIVTVMMAEMMVMTGRTLSQRQFKAPNSKPNMHSKRRRVCWLQNIARQRLPIRAKTSLLTPSSKG